MPTRLLPSLPLLIAILHCCCCRCCCGAAAASPLIMLDRCPADQSTVTAPLPQSVGAAVLLAEPSVRLQTVDFLNSGGLLRVENGSLVLSRSLDAAEFNGPYSGPYPIMCSDRNQELGTFNVYLQRSMQPPPTKSIPTNTNVTTPTPIATTIHVVITTPASTPAPSTKASIAQPSPHASAAEPPPPPPPASDPRVLPLAVAVGLLLALIVALSVALVLVARRVRSGGGSAGSGRAGALEFGQPSGQRLLSSNDRQGSPSEQQ